MTTLYDASSSSDSAESDDDLVTALPTTNPPAVVVAAQLVAPMSVLGLPPTMAYGGGATGESFGAMKERKHSSARRKQVSGCLAYILRIIIIHTFFDNTYWFIIINNNL